MFICKPQRAFVRQFSRSVTPCSLSPVLVCFLILSAVTTPVRAATADIHIMVSGDGRGSLEPMISDHTAIPLGGLARRATAIDQQRSAHADTLLLEAGDFLFGTHGTRVTSESIADAYRMMAYDAVNLGCSDFRFGKAFTQQLVQQTKLPVVSANLYDKPEGKRLFQPFTILEKSRRKVAVIGLTEPPVSRSLLPHLQQQLEGIYLQPLDEALDDILPEVQGEADAIILLYAGSAAGLQILRQHATDTVQIIASAGPGPVLTNSDGETPVLLSPLPNGRELTQAELTGGRDARALPSLLITPALPDNSALQSALQSHLATTPVSTDRVTLLPSPAATSEIPSALPPQPKLNHLYRIQGTMHNRGADIDLLGAGMFEQFGSLKARKGYRLLVLRTAWENIIPLVLKQNQGLATEYRFPNLGDHLYLVVDGKRLSRLLSKEEENIPGQLPTKPLSLPYIGMREEGNLVYEIPEEQAYESIELRMYDYAHGHDQYELLGKPATPPQPMTPRVANEVVEAGIFAFTTNESIGEVKADPGTTFVSIDFRAASRFTFEADATAFDPHAKKGSQIRIGTVSDWKEGDTYNHLIVNGSYAFRPRAELSQLDAEPRFLPDLMTGGRLVYQVPADFQSLALRADFPNARLPDGKLIRPQALVIPLMGTAPAPTSVQSLWNVSDDTLLVSIVGQTTVDQFAGEQAAAGRTYLVLEVDVFNQGDKPEFFQTDKQLSTIAPDGGQSAPDPLTYRGMLHPTENVWVPNGEHRRFQVVFEVQAGATEHALSYRGFTLEQHFSLNSSGVTELSTETAEGKVVTPKIQEPQITSVQAADPELSQEQGVDDEGEKPSDSPTVFESVEQPVVKPAPKPRIQLAAYKEFTPDAAYEKTLQFNDAEIAQLRQQAFLSLEQIGFQDFANRFGSLKTVDSLESPISLEFGKPVETIIGEEKEVEFTISVDRSLAKRGRVQVWVSAPVSGTKDEIQLYAYVSDAEERYPTVVSDGTTLSICDLQLPEGEHTIRVVHSEDAEVPIHIVAIAEANIDTRECENNSPEGFENPVKTNTALSGRMMPADDSDVFRWNVTEADCQRKWSIFLLTDPKGSGASLRLLKHENLELQFARAKAGEAITFVDLSPPAGDYLLRIAPEARDKACAYQLLVRDCGPAQPGWEREPNDECQPAVLPVFHPGKTEVTTVKGQFFGEETDYFVLDITEPDRVYTLSLHGDRARRISLVDSERKTLRDCQMNKNLKPALVDLSLPLGKNIFAVTGKSCDYIVGIEARAAPGPYVEREPNDTHLRAHRIEQSADYQGRLLDTYDDDCFRFVVQQAMDYRITIQAPDGETFKYRLEEDQNYLLGGTTRDASLPDTIRLYPGNHFIELSTDKPFYEPYTIRVEPMHPAGVSSQTVLLSSGTDAENPIVAAAYLDPYQQFEIPLTLKNSSDAEQKLQVAGWTSNYQVSLEASETVFTLAPKQERTLHVRGFIESDAASDGPVTLFIAARSIGQEQQTLGTWQGQLILDPNGAALSAAVGKGRIHSSLAGGLNVAAMDLGAVPQGENANSVEELLDNVLSHRVFDGKTAVVKLAGDGQVPLVGASFDLHGISRMMNGLKDYSIEISDDGQVFHEIARGQLSARPGNQDICFANEVKARYARLLLHDTQADDGDSSDEPELGEWRMIAKPGVSLPEFPEMDLLRESWGGHEIWRSESAVVYGFHHDRAGRIGAFEWRNYRKSHDNRKNPHQIQLSVSVSSPAGPWQEIGVVDVSAADTDENLKQRVALKDAPWARFVKLTWLEGESPLPENHLLPGIFEYHGEPSYRSLLGEWGGPVQEAGYELKFPKEIRSSWQRIDASSGKPANLAPNVWTESTVWINEDWEDWFTIEAPAGKQRKSIEVEGDPFVRVALEATDASGKPVTLVPRTTAPGKRAWALPMGAEGSYRIHVYEPMRSVVFIWDMSGSMSNFLDGIASAVVHFAQEVNPKTERVQLLPLDEPPTPLLKQWESNPYVLSDTVRNFDPPSSSYAHLNLLEASNMLAKEPGTRAAIMIADCETSREVNPLLWQSLQEVQPIVYTFHTTDVTRSFGVEQDDMQDWAAVGGGRYYLIQDPHQLDHAFGKLQSQLRRPAGYRIRTTEERLKKASIELLDNRQPESIEDPFDNGFLLILDMSASMRTPMPDGVTLRSQAAMEGLTRIIEQLPEGTQLGIRVFGQRGGADCASTLLMPVAPLDKAKTIEALRSIRVSSLGNTAIAEALERAPEDLAEVSGKRHIIILTDGEETCRGDPEAAIANLIQENGETKVSIAGFMLEDPAVQQKYQNWIGATGGAYYPAADSGSLEKVLRNAMTAAPAPMFEILDSEGKVVASGQVGNGSIELESGFYRIRTEDGDTTRFGLIEAIEKDIRLEFYPSSSKKP